jgi:hypothetical protein
MPSYLVAGYEEYPVLHLTPTEGDQGVELPAVLYGRWRQARAELDAVQREVIAHLRDAGGRDAIPEELWEARDRAADQPSFATRPWDAH